MTKDLGSVIEGAQQRSEHSTRTFMIVRNGSDFAFDFANVDALKRPTGLTADQKASGLELVCYFTNGRVHLS